MIFGLIVLTMLAIYWTYNGPIVRPSSIAEQPIGAPTTLPAFPIGVFEDANLIGGNTAKFAVMVNDVLSHSLDSVMFANNFANRDAPLLNVSDKLGLGVYMLPAGDLNTTWGLLMFPQPSKLLVRLRNLL